MRLHRHKSVGRTALPSKDGNHNWEKGGGTGQGVQLVLLSGLEQLGRAIWVELPSIF